MTKMAKVRAAGGVPLVLVRLCWRWRRGGRLDDVGAIALCAAAAVGDVMWWIGWRGSCSTTCATGSRH
jgi:hypothetical protein